MAETIEIMGTPFEVSHYKHGYKKTADGSGPQIIAAYLTNNKVAIGDRGTWKLYEVMPDWFVHG